MLTVVEVSDSLGGLEGRVGVPNTTSLVGNLLDRVRVGRVGRCDVLNRASLDTDNTNGDTTKASTTDNDGASPTAKSLLEGALVEQAGSEAIVFLLTMDEPSDVVGLLLGREVGDVTVPRVG